MFRNTQPNNGIEIDSHNGSLKGVNSIYTTFKGGYGEYNIDMTKWGYFCLWGHLRFCYSKTDLIDGWTHISLHGYRNGYIYIYAY